MLESYRKLTEFLGLILGPSSKVILYDLTLEPPQVVAISNGTFDGGRGIGSPLTDLARANWQSGEWQDINYSAVFPGRTREGRMLRSAYFYIKDASNRPIGMLCINTDVSRYQTLCEQILQAGGISELFSLKPVLPETHPTEYYSENFSEVDLGDMIDAVVADLFGEMPPARLTQAEKMAVVEQLTQRGAFLIKGAVNETAAKLSCSGASIYRYLSKLSQKAD